MYAGIDWGVPGGDTAVVSIFEALTNPLTGESTYLRIRTVPGRGEPNRDPQEMPGDRFAIIHSSEYSTRRDRGEDVK